MKTTWLASVSVNPSPPTLLEHKSSPTSSRSSTRPGEGKFSDSNRVEEVLSRIPDQVLEDQQYQNARRNSGRQNAQVELDPALRRLITSMVRRHTELYKAYTEDGEFQEWLNVEMFRVTYRYVVPCLIKGQP